MVIYTRRRLRYGANCKNCKFSQTIGYNQKTHKAIKWCNLRGTDCGNVCPQYVYDGHTEMPQKPKTEKNCKKCKFFQMMAYTGKNYRKVPWCRLHYRECEEPCDRYKRKR